MMNYYCLNIDKDSNKHNRLQYFGGIPKVIVWREFKNVIVAVICDSQDVNLANISVFMSFLLKEVWNLKEEERKERFKEEASSNFFFFD